MIIGDDRKWPEYRGWPGFLQRFRLDRMGGRSPCRVFNARKNSANSGTIDDRQTRQNPSSRCCCARRAASAPAWCAPSNRSSGRSRTMAPPVYVRHEIVHNRYVVESLKAKGAIFVEELDEIPETDAPVIFSAHGVPKSVPEEAARRNLFTLDATCPLVTKVHREAEIHHRRGREIVLIGHAGHPEVVGTMGQLPAGAITLVETLADAEAFTPRDAGNLAYVTQTTLSVDDTADIVAVLKRRFPEIVGPHKEDICYATTNRQEAVQARGARRRRPGRGRRAQLVELAAAGGSGRARRLPRAALVQRAADIDWTMFEGVKTLGVTAGASAPEVLVEEILDAFAERYALGRRDRLRRRGGDVLPAAAPAARGAGGGVTLSWPSTPTSRRTSSRVSRRLRPRRAARLQGHRRGRGEFQLPAPHRRPAISSSRSTRSAWRSRDLPFFLALMEHLAARGITCPQPVQNKQRRHARQARRPAGGDRHLSRRHVDPPPEPPAIAPRSARRWRAASRRRRFPHEARQCAVVASWRPLYEQAEARADSVRRRPVRGDRQGTRRAGKGLAARPAAGRDPRRSVSRQRVLPRRQRCRG